MPDDHHLSQARERNNYAAITGTSGQRIKKKPQKTASTEGSRMLMLRRAYLQLFNLTVQFALYLKTNANRPEKGSLRYNKRINSKVKVRNEKWGLTYFWAAESC